MTRRDLLARSTGVGVLIAGWASCLWLRALVPEGRHDPTLVELALVVAGFVLTLAGTLLILHGEKLLRGAGPARGRRDLPRNRGS
ncbi:hypothetical protein [Sphingomonas crusticola]|uniref:hypothetical protein n=1 Tax=Sphingomonas crusticola TaxID=1697973 RepID=UPI000E24045E|nr:hypothetical protein [Sphingomonas crusticola]